MNRRIKKEWNKLGYKGKTKMPLKECSSKLFHLIAIRNARLEKRKMLVKKLTINDVKRAIRQDGNFKLAQDKVSYIKRQIATLFMNGQINGTQQEKLFYWAVDKFS